MYHGKTGYQRTVNWKNVEGDGNGLQVFLGTFEGTPKNVSEEGWSPGRQLNWGAPKYEAGLLTTHS